MLESVYGGSEKYEDFWQRVRLQSIITSLLYSFVPFAKNSLRIFQLTKESCLKKSCHEVKKGKGSENCSRTLVILWVVRHRIPSQQAIERRIFLILEKNAKSAKQLSNSFSY